MDEQVITLFNIEKLNHSLEIIKEKSLKLTIEQYNNFEDISQIVLAYNDLKNSIIGLDNIQQFIIKNKTK